MTIPQTGAPDAIISTVTGGIPTLTGTWTSARTWTFPDRSDTFAGLAAQTFTGAQTINLSGVTPSTAWIRANTPALNLISLPATVTGFYVESYGVNNGGQSGFACGGTATSPSATTSGLILTQSRAWGWDGTGTTQQNAGRLSWSATETWTSTAHGSMPTLQGVGAGTTSTMNLLAFDATTGFCNALGLSISSTTASTSTTTGSIVTAGGIGVAGNSVFGGSISQTGGQFYYLRGDASTDGSCRISSPSSGNVTIEIRVSGAWVEKQRWS